MRTTHNGAFRIAAVLPAMLAFAAWAAGANAATHPSIVGVAVAPAVVPAGGGAVVVRVQVRNATRCAFQAQRSSTGGLVAGPTVACGSGTAVAHFSVAKNGTGHRATIHFRVTARDAHGATATRAASVPQAAGSVPAPQAPLAVAPTTLPGATVGVTYAANLSATGGAHPYTWSLGGGTLPAGLSLSAAGAIAGTPSAAGQFTFAVAVKDAKGATATSQLTITVATPTVTIPAASSVGESLNWSGYVLEGGTYTAVKGTFNVPTIFRTATDTSTAEWVGIDGTSPSNPGIIQAGVAEDYSAASNTYFVTPWIELYPAPPVAVPLHVSPGDNVTVTITQVGGGVWNIDMRDQSNSTDYTTSATYTGPAISAEWIVEAPFSTVTNSIETLGQFSPVTFSGLGVNPLTGSSTRVIMFQNDVPVSVPSDVTPNGFTVAYGGGTPSPP